MGTSKGEAFSIDHPAVRRRRFMPNPVAVEQPRDRTRAAVEATRLSLFEEGFWHAEHRRPGALYFALKRFGDIIISLIAITLLSPVMLAVALAIKLESRGPLIYQQVRSGLLNKPFMMFKFRSMRAHADEMKSTLMAMNEMDGPVFKIKDDPRVTRVGKFIRRWSLDELPQLFNILRGEMTIVGPRPLPVEEVALLDERQMARQSVKPGLTCIWQISGRNEIPFEEWIQLDLIYIAHRSTLIDFEIFLRTFFAVLSRKGSR
jgi:lipopolysaccharide/colanic/teichoic acid biosynthesis glycosyltransferase